VSANASSSFMTVGPRDLNVAIQQHASRGSEANTVINNYNMLSQTDQQVAVELSALTVKPAV